ncbi:potassium channel family protein [Psychroflexus salinarum]|uniref:Potassium channel family protein n=1 Tax=Psychroflexus salinarum TaxID=546024 RepID=A0ABW3GQC9_9FLAO
MKYIIVGLGNFGSSLAQKLTALGNEVIAIDDSMEKVEHFKEKVTHTIRMDATDELAVSDLPFDETDIVLIAIGEDQGSNLMATALFKNLGAKRLISRAINPLHKKVLEAIGVDEIVHPESETAERWSNKLHLKNVIDSFELNDDFSIIEAQVPKKYVGKTIKELKIREEHDLLILTIIQREEKTTQIGEKEEVDKIEGIADPNVELEEKDILVIFGKNSSIDSFIGEKSSEENQDD